MSTGNGSKTRSVGAGDRVRAVGLRFARGRMMVALADDREVSVPLAWYPTLARASSAQRSRWKMLGKGEGFHWPALDVDLSMLREIISRPPRPRVGRPVDRPPTGRGNSA